MNARILGWTVLVVNPVTKSFVSAEVFATAAGLRRRSLRGMVYDPFRRDWRRSSDTGVNYLFAAMKQDV